MLTKCLSGTWFLAKWFSAKWFSAKWFSAKWFLAKWFSAKWFSTKRRVTRQRWSKSLKKSLQANTMFRLKLDQQTRCQCYKTFSLQNELECCISKVYRNSLIFASVPLYASYSYMKKLTGEYTLAYFVRPSMIKKKYFITLAPYRWFDWATMSLGPVL